MTNIIIVVMFLWMLSDFIKGRKKKQEYNYDKWIEDDGK